MTISDIININLWIYIQSTSYVKQEILSQLGKQIHISILISRMETWKFFRFTEWNPKSFPVYVTEPGNYSVLQNGDWNFSGLRNETQKFFRFTE